MKRSEFYELIGTTDLITALLLESLGKPFGSVIFGILALVSFAMGLYCVIKNK